MATVIMTFQSVLINTGHDNYYFYLIKSISFSFAGPNNTQHKILNLPSPGDRFVETKGSCGNGTTDQNITIIWLSDDSSVNTLNLTFRLNSTSKPNEFSLYEAVFNLSSSVLPNNSTNRFYHVGGFFETPISKSYHCTRVQILNLTNSEDPKSVIAGTVSLSHVIMEAYRTDDNQNYSTSIDCDAMNTPGMN